MELILPFLKNRSLTLLSSDYGNTPVKLREKLAINNDEIATLITHLKKTCNLEEVLILSTCNRIEIYAVSLPLYAVASKIEKEILAFKQITPQEIFACKYNEEALEHLFQVEAGLKSMILGETQITGQLKQAFTMAVQAKSIGFILHKAIQLAASTAKQIRTSTDISKFAVSISFAAVELAQKIFNNLAEQKVLLIGAGEVAELAALHLQKAGCQRIMVTNRTQSRAVELANKFDAVVLPFSTLAQNIEEADIIITSTGADEAIVYPEMLAPCMPKRKYRPLFFIDISVPRNVASACNDIEDVYIYDIDDLQTVVDSNFYLRQQAATEAQVFIQESLDIWQKWAKSLVVVPILKAFREKMKTIADEELKLAERSLSTLNEEQQQVVKTMLSRVVNKILHSPTVKLKENASLSENKETNWQTIDLLSDLFALSIDEKDGKNSKINELINEKSSLRLLS